MGENQIGLIKDAKGQEEIIKAVDNLLAMAKRGEIIALTFCAHQTDRSFSTGIVYQHNHKHLNFLQVVGQIEIMKHDFIGRAESLPPKD